MFIVHAVALEHRWSWEFFASGEEAVERAERLIANGATRRADVYAATHAKTPDAAQASVELGIAQHLLSKSVKARIAAE